MELEGSNLNEWVKSKLLVEDIMEGIEGMLHMSLRQGVLVNVGTSSHGKYHLAGQLLRVGCTEDNPNNCPAIREVLPFISSNIKSGSHGSAV
eukprot:c35142_g1_i1 orf=8-283(-)